MKLEYRRCSNRVTHRFCLFLFVFTAFLFLTDSRVSYAATVPSGFTDSLVVNGLSSPTAMAFSPDGRLFVCEQGGNLRVVKNGTLLSTPFLTVSVDSSGERGLLGVAFDPNFSANQYVYIYYTVPSTPRHNRISRFTANGDVAVPGSEITILELDNLSGATNHNGGAIHFGIDGKLYAAVGDNANSSNAQTLATLHGKMLRINPDPLAPIPSDNPYPSATGNNRAIWAMGLRNPFTFSFQPGIGRMFINDVGQSTWEEVNDGIAGSNYGWAFCEGFCTPSNPSYRDPLYAYMNDASTCAITGGAFYNPQTAQFPGIYVGNYFFADFCGGWIRKLDPANNNAVTGFASGISSPVDLKVSTDGSLYYLARGTGSVGRIQNSTNDPSYEADVSSRPRGDGSILSDDVVQVRKFLNGTDTPNQATGEFQRADSSPFDTRGDGQIFSDDVVQARRYQNGTNPKQVASGPITPTNIPQNLTDGFDKTTAELQSPEGNPREVRVENAMGSAGQNVTVNIRVNAVGNESEYGFIINYDSTILSNPVTGAGTAGASVRSCNIATIGQVNCSVGGFPNNQMGSSEPGIGEIAAGTNQLLITVQFTIAANAQPGTTPLTLSNVNASSDAPQLLFPAATNGTVTILAPTAASSQISGRVVTTDGRAVSKARVTLTDQNGEVRSVLTSVFGYYRFDDVMAGETYIISAEHKQYRFETKVINANENLSEVNFIALDSLPGFRVFR